MDWFSKSPGIFALLGSVVLTTLGCSPSTIGGTLSTPPNNQEPSTSMSNPTTPTTKPPSPPSQPIPLGQAFTRTPSEGQLLPFSVRLERLAKVAGVTPQDPILSPVVENRLHLGDHNYANGIKPDRIWSASKMSLWTKSILPLCSSDSFRARYGNLPENLNALLLEAYGRPATAVDMEDLQTSFANLDATSKHQMTCVAVLSSAEFVLQ